MVLHGSTTVLVGFEWFQRVLKGFQKRGLKGVLKGFKGF